MYLTIYDESLIALGVVDVYISVIWIRRDTGYGSFEITVPATENNLALLVKRNIVQKGNDLEVGYIRSVFSESDSKKKDVITARGEFYCGVLNQRCVLTNAADLKTLIENNLRGLNLIAVDSLVSSITFDNNFIGENLGECITALAKAKGFGFKTLLDRSTGKINFSIYYGVDRSIEQSVNPYIIFSDNYENLKSASYLDSDIGAVNTVYARCKLPAGIENCTPPTYDISDGSGVGKFEKYIEVEAVTYDTEVFLPEGGSVMKTYLDVDKTLAEMQAAAKAELVAIQNNFQGEVDFKLNYRVEYDLGDIVTVKNDKWGKVINQRITEIMEVYDNTSNAITPTFGNPARTIMDILKKVK